MNWSHEEGLFRKAEKLLKESRPSAKQGPAFYLSSLSKPTTFYSNPHQLHGSQGSQGQKGKDKNGLKSRQRNLCRVLIKELQDVKTTVLISYRT